MIYLNYWFCSSAYSLGPCFCHLITPHVSDLRNELRCLYMLNTSFMHLWVRMRQAGNTDHKYWNGLRVGFINIPTPTNTICCFDSLRHDNLLAALSEEVVDLSRQIIIENIMCMRTTRNQLNKHMMRLTTCCCSVPIRVLLLLKCYNSPDLGVFFD